MSDEHQATVATVPPADRGGPARCASRSSSARSSLGGAAIVLARHYKRPDPPTEPAAPGMTVGSDSVTLANDAPMWGVVKLAPAQPAEPHWTDPVPARIVFDEARTSRLGSPLAGRVTAVMSSAAST